MTARRNVGSNVERAEVQRRGIGVGRLTPLPEFG